MKSWNDDSSPTQATPTKSTCPAHRCAAASTEGASRLQTLQVGAQNQKAVGRPAADAPSNSPPPTRAAVKSNTDGVVAPVSLGATFGARVGAMVGTDSATDPELVRSAEPHPARVTIAVTAAVTAAIKTLPPVDFTPPSLHQIAVGRWRPNFVVQTFRFGGHASIRVCNAGSIKSHGWSCR